MIALLAMAFAACNTSTTTTAPAQPEKSIDSLVTQIQADYTFIVKEVYYDTTEHILNISLDNSENSPESDYKNCIAYFTSTYKIDEYTQIDAAKVYLYKKGKSLARGEYKKPVSLINKKHDQEIEAFLNKHYTEYGGYMPITMYLRHNLNDPSSLEIADCYKCIKNESGNFICVCDFRAKNKFGALVLSRATAEITPAGDIVTIDIK